MKNKIIYGAAINLVGVWGPLKMELNKEQKVYYDKSGNLSIRKIGLNIYEDVIEFGSKNKKEVEIWVNGIKCAFKRLSDFAYRGKEIKSRRN